MFLDLRCDPSEPGLAVGCEYDPNVPGACPAAQDPTCLAVCLPLTPNGCDCFGCCELPAESGQYVYIGAMDNDGTPTCTESQVNDPALCPPCVPVADCFNDCQTCERCLGKASTPVTCVPEDDLCLEGFLPCGSPGLELCPQGMYCITGCCQFSPN